MAEPLSAETVRAAATVLEEEGTPIDDHRASAAYLRSQFNPVYRRKLPEKF